MEDTAPFRCVVLIKQVPDTHNLTGDVMTEEGTMNRSALPTIYNPEDLNALEMALQVCERYGGTVTVITMGPPKAADILRESLFRGADKVILLSDRKFAGADTLATSYALKCAVEKSGPFDLVFCGRQAIDGDTAQVGPQLAEKLHIPQITYAEAVLELNHREITVQRALDLGTEMVRCTLPCLLTVVSTANSPRPASARKSIALKKAAASLEYAAILKKRPEFKTEAELDAFLTANNLKIPVWTAEDIGAKEEQVGLAGSPTQVHKVNFVVLESTANKEIPPTKQGIAEMIEELVQEYIVG
jgi:electron transfer flavoprotein beta subunit